MKILLTFLLSVFFCLPALAIDMRVDVGSIESVRGAMVFSVEKVPVKYSGVLLETRCYGTNNRFTQNPVSPAARVTTKVNIQNKTFRLNFPGKMTNSSAETEEAQLGELRQAWRGACLDYCKINPSKCKKQKKKKCKWYKCLAKAFKLVIKSSFAIFTGDNPIKMMAQGAACQLGSLPGAHSFEHYCMTGSFKNKLKRSIALKNMGNLNQDAIQGKFVDAMKHGTPPCDSLPYGVWGNANGACYEIMKDEHKPVLRSNQKPIRYECSANQYLSSFSSKGIVTKQDKVNCDYVQNRCATDNSCRSLCALHTTDSKFNACRSTCSAKVNSEVADYDNPTKYKCDINGSDASCLGRFLTGPLVGIKSLKEDESVKISHSQDAPGDRPCGGAGRHKWGGTYKGCDGALTVKSKYSINAEENFVHIKAEYPGEDGFCGGYHSPLMLFFDYKHASFTNRSDFVGRDLGVGETYWPEANHNGFFLAYLEDGEKIISSTARLFGENTMNGDGFSALSKFDDNYDSKIDAKDEIYSKLVLWKDIDGNGRSSEDEIVNLKKFGITELALNVDQTYRFDYSRRAIAKGRAFFKYKRGNKVKKGEMLDIFFKEYDF